MLTCAQFAIGFAFPLNVGLYEMFIMCKEKNNCLHNKCYGMLIHISVSLSLWQLTTYSRGFILFILVEGMPIYDKTVTCTYNINLRGVHSRSGLLLSNYFARIIHSVNILFRTGFTLHLHLHRQTLIDTMQNECTDKLKRYLFERNHLEDEEQLSGREIDGNRLGPYPMSSFSINGFLLPEL
jgi:hypothetical protein